LGFGPSAHSFLGSRRFANVNSLQKYIKSPYQNWKLEENLFPDQIQLETDYLALRLGKSLEIERLKPNDFNMLESSGRIKRTSNGFCCTPLGWLILDSIVTLLS
jgi:coproporphyrinogen III oxidase-like Fe-S oxidoreductase